MFTLIQSVHTATGCSHCNREFTLLQGVHIATGCSHCYRVSTLLPGVHIATGCSHCYRVFTLLQGVPVIAEFELMSAAIRQTRRFKGIHGGLVNSHDKLGQRHGESGLLSAAI